MSEEQKDIFDRLLKEQGDIDMNPPINKYSENIAFLEGFRIAWIIIRPGHWNIDVEKMAQDEFNQWEKTKQ